VEEEVEKEVEEAPVGEVVVGVDMEVDVGS